MCLTCCSVCKAKLTMEAIAQMRKQRVQFDVQLIIQTFHWLISEFPTR